MTNYKVKAKGQEERKNMFMIAIISLIPGDWFCNEPTPGSNNSRRYRVPGDTADETTQFSDGS